MQVSKSIMSGFVFTDRYPINRTDIIIVLEINGGHLKFGPGNIDPGP